MCKTALAEHEWNIGTGITFFYENGSTYSIWYKVGGGGGHSLTVRNLTISSVILGDAGGHLARQHRSLISMGVHSLENRALFFPLFRAVCGSVHRQHTSPLGVCGDENFLQDIMAWFDSMGLSAEDETSLRDLIGIVSEYEASLDLVNPNDHAIYEESLDDEECTSCCLIL